MGFHFGCKWLLLALLLASPAVSFIAGDAEKDREECTQQLAGMATCLAYVSGDAKAPTPDCCSGLKGVLKSNKKCLCVIVKDRNDPDLGLQINVTLALGLPDVCHAPANVSNCPALLNLPPSSPEAQVFYQFGKAQSSSAAAAPISPSPAINSTGGGSRNGTDKGEAYTIGNKWLPLKTLVVGALLVLSLLDSYHV
ncbi:Protein YLS3 [Cucurbita argyrosperma subsp. argyrosperma]